MLQRNPPSADLVKASARVFAIRRVGVGADSVPSGPHLSVQTTERGPGLQTALLQRRKRCYRHGTGSAGISVDRVPLAGRLVLNKARASTDSKHVARRKTPHHLFVPKDTHGVHVNRAPCVRQLRCEDIVALEGLGVIALPIIKNEPGSIHLRGQGSSGAPILQRHP